MKEYKIEITEVLQRQVVVKADSELEAIIKVEDLYHDSQIVLDASDHVQTDIIAVRSR